MSANILLLLVYFLSSFNLLPSLLQELQWVPLDVRAPNALKTDVRFLLLHWVGKICKLIFFLLFLFLYADKPQEILSTSNLITWKYIQFFPVMISIRSNQEWLKAGFFQTNKLGWFNCSVVDHGVIHCPCSVNHESCASAHQFSL